MIIKKKNFALTPGFKAKDWPFSVPEITIMGIIIENDGKKLQCFIIIHNWVGYALSGFMENYGYVKLEESGIWAPATHAAQCIPEPKKSLSPFFKYLERKTSEK